MSGRDEVIKELREKTFEGNPFKSLQPMADGRVGMKEL